MNGLPDSLLARSLRALVVVVLVLVPFHAFLTVWFSMWFGHYTALRLWKEVLLSLLVALTVVLLVRRPEIWQKLLQNSLQKKLLVLIGVYIALFLTVASISFFAGTVTTKALGYALISDLRFLVFFVACLVVGVLHRDWVLTHWKQLLLWPAGIVVAFGLLQYLVLPADFLKHFGYGVDTIAPYIAIDQKPDYARVQSTLRGPNPLGTYLLIAITALVGALFALRKHRKLFITLTAASMVVLFGTYSRSAWLGTCIALGVLIWLIADKSKRKLLGVVAASTVIVAAGAIVMLRNNDLVQNVVFHTDENSVSNRSSNEDRANALSGGVSDLVREPLGRGPGTAGPASVYNNEGRLAENYFLQVGQELGLLGLSLFVGICIITELLLWRLRTEGPLPLLLFASFIGLVFVNLLSHAWADDTLAYIWWGFAGLTVGAYAVDGKVKRKKKYAKKAV